MIRRKGPALSPSGYIQSRPLRGPDEPTDWDLAAERLGERALREWVGRNYRSKYVPEAVLTACGLEPPW